MRQLPGMPRPPTIRRPGLAGSRGWALPGLAPAGVGCRSRQPPATTDGTITPPPASAASFISSRASRSGIASAARPAGPRWWTRRRPSPCRRCARLQNRASDGSILCHASMARTSGPGRAGRCGKPSPVVDGDGVGQRVELLSSRFTSRNRPAFDLRRRLRRLWRRPLGGELLLHLQLDALTCMCTDSILVGAGAAEAPELQSSAAAMIEELQRRNAQRYKPGRHRLCP